MTEDRSFGAIVVFENKFLIIQQTAGHWGFPKGHAEGGETAMETVIRELEEETGITRCRFIDVPPILEEYTFDWGEGKIFHKIVQYCVGFASSDAVKIQEEEIKAYKWASYDEAFAALTYDNNKEVLKQAKAYLDEYESKK